MTKQNDNAKFFIAAALGGLAGAAIALLFAPKSGKETRAQLAETSGRVKKSGSSRVWQLSAPLVGQPDDTSTAEIPRI